MKRLAFALLILAAAAAPPARATFNASAGLRVFPGLGSSTNGGGFDNQIASAGTDYSLNNNANAPACSNCGSSTVDLSTTDLVTNGTTTIVSAGATFQCSTIRGNIIFITGGTGALASQRRTVTACTNTTTVTVDATLAAGTGATMNIGGALDTITTALGATSFSINGMGICVKSTGTITLTANIVLTQNQNAIAWNRLFGYSSVCGDHGPVDIVLSTNTGLTAIQGAGVAAGWWVDGFRIDCSSLGTSTGVSFNGQSQLTNTKVSNCTTRGVLAGNNSQGMYNEITGCTSACTEALNAGGTSVWKFNYIHDNVALCATVTGNNIFHRNLVANCTGAGHDGIQYAAGTSVDQNIVYNVAQDCVRQVGSTNAINDGTSVQNNILSTCGRYGQSSPSGVFASPQFDGNAYFNVSTANRNNLDGAMGIALYTNVWEISCGTDPFINAAAGNFQLSSTTACGVALRGTGQPGFIGPQWGKATGAGFADYGAFQSQFGTGAAGVNVGSVQ